MKRINNTPFHACILRFCERIDFKMTLAMSAWSLWMAQSSKFIIMSHFGKGGTHSSAKDQVSVMRLQLP
jgi:hypothetical protein